MNNRKFEHGYSGAIILIVTGCILLLNNLGIIPWAAWDELWSWWPLIIIYYGFDIISENNKKLREILTILELFIILAIVLSILFPTNIPRLPFGLPHEV
ncbi:MAG: DUF5668 domain-containing protein [Patescibacteria group bacterium]|jgi:hypothetical protein